MSVNVLQTSSLYLNQSNTNDNNNNNDKYVVSSVYDKDSTDSSSSISNSSSNLISSSSTSSNNTIKAINDSINVNVNNVVCSYSTRCHLNLRRIATEGMNVEYKKENGMIHMKLRKPQTTANIWSSGKITCTGAKSENEAYQAARRFTRLLQKIGFKVKLCNYRVVNVLATCSMPFEIDIVKLTNSQPRECSYEPELHPGATYKLKEFKTTFKIFTTGSITLTAPTVDVIHNAITKLYPILYEHRKIKLEEPKKLVVHNHNNYHQSHNINNYFNNNNNNHLNGYIKPHLNPQLVNYTLKPIVQNTHLINSNNNNYNNIRQYSVAASTVTSNVNNNHLTLIQQPQQTTYLQPSLITSPQSSSLLNHFISPTTTTTTISSLTTQNSFNNTTNNNNNNRRSVFYDEFNNDDFLP